MIPQDNEVVLQAVLAQRAQGDEQGAAQRCEQAIRESSGGDPGLKLMQLHAQLRFPGPGYLENLALIHALLRPRSYLEIGVANGHSIALAQPGTRAIGVDPAPNIRVALPGTTTIFRETSDAFFEQRPVRALFGGLPIDLAFIDGMHLFEFALRDFINLERHCDLGSTILFDDCWPLSALAAARDRVTHFWNGDVWRILPALRKHRPDLRIRTLATYPAGLCVVRGLDPGSVVLAERYADIVSEFGALDYSAFEAQREAYLEPCANDRDSLLRILT